MNNRSKIVIFIVGLGAPASLYSDYLESLKESLPQSKLFVLEWWSQDDFGFHALQSYLGNSEVVLIGHSAGSVIALQALAQWSSSVKKIIMLDSHFLRTQGALPTVPKMLDIMLSKGESKIKNRVENAYATHIDNSLVFNKAFQFAVEWVNTGFDQACHILKTIPLHSALFVGFTNSAYQLLSIDDENTLSILWLERGVDVKFFPMNHFDLIDESYAVSINRWIAGWLRFSPLSDP